LTLLKQATLSQIAEELRRRARRTCRGCGGYGHVCPPPWTSAMATTCPRCRGAGLEPWPELLALAQELSQLEPGGHYRCHECGSSSPL